MAAGFFIVFWGWFIIFVVYYMVIIALEINCL